MTKTGLRFYEERLRFWGVVHENFRFELGLNEGGPSSIA